ncbi:MAG: HD domain-containing phosphohydrolase [Kosmotogaceae bacterium]
MKKVLIIDDIDENRYLLHSLFKNHDWNVIEACDGADGLEKAQKELPDLIISDLLMPVMDGYTLLRKCKESEQLKEIPFVVYTATYTDQQDKQLAFDLGADAFIIKPMDPKEFMEKIDDLLETSKIDKSSNKTSSTAGGNHYKEYSEVLVHKLEKKIKELEEANKKFEEEITKRKEIEEELRKSNEKLANILESTVNALAYITELRDQYTAGHQRRVKKLAKAIAERMNLDEEQISNLELAAVVHDVGKIVIPAEILNKPGKLSELEMTLIHLHPTAGRDIFKQVVFAIPISEIIYQHHERINGSGYPQGLSDNEIMIEAKILAIADVVEAMSSHRPYRPAPGIEAAIEEIEKNAGILYDEEVVKTCIKILKEEDFTFED